MERPSYLSKYLFNWELLDIIWGGKAAIDSEPFIGSITDELQIYSFVKGYGINPDDPVAKSEIFGTFQESLQFIKRYFLKESNPEGLDFKIPGSLYQLTDINELFWMARTGHNNKEEQLWAEIVLKIMHTILHVDRDLRSSYFTIIQTQIVDRFYKFIHRDKNNNLFLESKNFPDLTLPLVNFETKAKKSRDSVIIKLLHKPENVAEELFDRVGVRFITKNRFDALRVVKHLIEMGIIIPHNSKPSRSLNTLIDIPKFKNRHRNIIKLAMRNNLSEERFVQALEREVLECLPAMNDTSYRNFYTSRKYTSLQFTCHQLIKYTNPFYQEFKALRTEAKESSDSNLLAKKILAMDLSLISNAVHFFYPFEVQVVDQAAHDDNTKGEASHQKYKKAQAKSAMYRIFKELLKFKKH